MANPFNQLPRNPEWEKRVDELCANAAKVLECDVVMIAGKENAKLGVAIEGRGKIADIFREDASRALALLAMITRASDQSDQREPRQ